MAQRCTGTQRCAKPTTRRSLYEQVMSKARSVLLEGSVSGHRTARTNANALFDRLDEGKTGRVSVRDLRKSVTLDDRQFRELLQRLKVPPSGEIDRETFDAGFATYVTSQVRHLKRSLTVGGLDSPPPPRAMRASS